MFIFSDQVKPFGVYSRQFEVEGDTDKVYTISVRRLGGRFECSCPAWTYPKGHRYYDYAQHKSVTTEGVRHDCKHIDFVKDHIRDKESSDQLSNDRRLINAINTLTQFGQARVTIKNDTVYIALPEFKT